MASEATTASEVKSDLRLGINGSIFKCRHICLDSLGLFDTFLNFIRKKGKKGRREMNQLLLDMYALPQVKMCEMKMTNWPIGVFGGILEKTKIHK